MLSDLISSASALFSALNEAYPQLWLWLFLFSVFAFVATLVFIPWLILRIPRDYFLDEQPRHPGWLRMPRPLRLLAHLLKNALGLALVLVGILLLVLPGQGLLTIVFGLLLMDFPGRYRLQRWLIQRPSVLNSINWLRQRYDRPPLRFRRDEH